jgi:two-component system, LytTR family, sensor kinase
MEYKIFSYTNLKIKDKEPFLRKKFLEFAFQVIAWTLIISIPFFFVTPPNVTHRGTPLPMLVHWLILSVFYFLNYYILIPHILLKKRVFLYVTLIILCTIVLIFFPELFIRFMKDADKQSISSEFHVIGQLSSCVSFLTIFLVSSSSAVIKELFDIWHKKQIAEAEKIEAELASLRLQVNPHFLFNTLYSIHFLTINKSDKAADAILKLSDMMRFLLFESQENFIPLQKEVEFICKYINLQELRIPENTKVKFKLTGDYTTRQIAPLILFPFVENAFKYGVSTHIETSIYIGLLISEKMIQFDVSNTKLKTINEIEQNNIGLKNVSNRLNLIYPQLHELKIFNEKNSFSIELRIFYNEECMIYKS